ncbi:MAG TPA: hypothetical protein DCZ69_09370 [Syntrophobacteraceae bacterium]|nr:hypothetical protein [Syntrophobacteraceae bacterium]HBD08460.1 hypothetical protein [Syntrophobacteraceae bacterium]
MADLKTPSFWDDIKPGSVIVLNDAQALMEAVKRGLDADGGINYEIKRILRLTELNEVARWTLLKLEGVDEVWFMVKVAGQEMDLRIYFEVPEFPPGSRADMIAKEMYWLFEDPGPNWQTNYNELRFVGTVNIDSNPDGKTPAARTSYLQKPFGPMYARCSEQPRGSALEDYLATVVEYGTTDKTDNPDMLLLELGGEESPEGGYIMMMLGCAVSASDVRVFKK